jgi:SAM-dependent methyltransferase
MGEGAAPGLGAYPFDAVADQYDRTFTDTRLGRWLRGQVWQALAVHFHPGSRILELGAATGEDALWLAARGVEVVATEVSAGMLNRAREKVARAPAGERIELHQIDWNAAAATPPGDWPYDGVLANFGVLNCIEDRRSLVARIAPALRPGARVVVVVMGPLCAWELAWSLAHGDVETAFRRVRPRTSARLAGGPAFPVWYPSPRRLCRELEPVLRRVSLAPIGFLLPPSELAGLVERWPRLFAALAALDRRAAAHPVAGWLADHYLAVFERVA